MVSYIKASKTLDSAPELCENIDASTDFPHLNITITNVSCGTISMDGGIQWKE